MLMYYTARFWAKPDSALANHRNPGVQISLLVGIDIMAEQTAHQADQWQLVVQTGWYSLATHQFLMPLRHSMQTTKITATFGFMVVKAIGIVYNWHRGASRPASIPVTLLRTGFSAAENASYWHLSKCTLAVVGCTSLHKPYTGDNNWCGSLNVVKCGPPTWIHWSRWNWLNTYFTMNEWARSTSVNWNEHQRSRFSYCLWNCHSFPFPISD